MKRRAWVAVLVLDCASCALFEDTQSKDAAGDLQTSADIEDLVVVQAGLRNPIVSRLSRDQWITIRDNAKDPAKRLYGMLATGDWQAATDAARLRLRTQPKDLAALSVLAAGLVMERRYPLAAYYAGLIEKYYPGSPESLNIQGIATVMMATNPRLSDFRRAETLFKQAMDKDSREIAAALNQGSLFLELGNARSAVDAFRAADTRCGGCTQARLGLGIAASRVGQWEEARDALQGVLSRNKSNPEGLYHMALVYKNGYNDSQRATQYLQQLVTEASPGSGVLRDKAFALMRILKTESEDRKPASNQEH